MNWTQVMKTIDVAKHLGCGPCVLGFEKVPNIYPQEQPTAYTKMAFWVHKLLNIYIYIYMYVCIT